MLLRWDQCVSYASQHLQAKLARHCRIEKARKIMAATPKQTALSFGPSAPPEKAEVTQW